MEGVSGSHLIIIRRLWKHWLPGNAPADMVASGRPLLSDTGTEIQVHVQPFTMHPRNLICSQHRGIMTVHAPFNRVPRLLHNGM